jgi:hypothetical protein
MSKRKIIYLIHDLCAMTQTIRGGQRNLLAYMGTIGCRIDKNSLKAHISDSAIEVRQFEYMFISDDGHRIVVEELFE